MEEEPNGNQIVRIGATRCTIAERDSAIGFGTFLFDEWQKSRKDEIIEMDMTKYDNEEPTNN